MCKLNQDKTRNSIDALSREFPKFQLLFIPYDCNFSRKTVKWIGNFAPRIDIEIGSALRNNSDLSRTRSSREGNYNKKKPRHVSPNDITSSLRFQSPQLTCFPNVRSLMSSTEKLSNNYHGHESVARCNFRSFHSGQERPDACEWTMIITVQWIQGAMITGTSCSVPRAFSLQRTASANEAKLQVWTIIVRQLFWLFSIALNG